MRNGIHRRNVHLNSFDPDQNDPSTSFNNMRGGYESLNALTEAISHSFSVLHRPLCCLMDILCDYDEICRMLENATIEAA